MTTESRQHHPSLTVLSRRKSKEGEDTERIVVVLVDFSMDDGHHVVISPHRTRTVPVQKVDGDSGIAEDFLPMDELVVLIFWST